MTAMMKMATNTIGATMLGFAVAAGLCAEEVIVEVWDTHMVVATVYSVVHSVV
jgi:hypothetical protein